MLYHISVNTSRRIAYSYIRMSTNMQRKGDSLRRQLQKSTEYARKHDLELHDGTELRDIGVSAFKGANVADGALGTFLKALKEGKIESGAVLLVESLDRLSRQEILKSLRLFLDIIDAGVEIVTLINGKSYSGASFDVNDLMVSIGEFSRANNEARTKSERVGEAWANKRAQAGSRPLTKWCPAWLRLKPDRSGYEVIEERAAVVRSLFQDSAAGLGTLVLIRRLNEGKIPPFGSSKGWHNSYVARILASRSVLGEFQPCKLGADGKRRPDGPAIAGYFPATIDESLFYRAQQGRKERSASGKGRKGQYLTNLFSGLARCRYCDGKMRLARKGPGPKGGSYLVCEAALRGMACIRSGWSYPDFEKSFLAFVEQVNLSSLVHDDDSKTKQIERDIQALLGRKVALEEQMAWAYGLHEIDGGLKFVADKLGALQRQLSQVESEIAKAYSEQQALIAEALALSRSKVELHSLIETLQVSSDPSVDLYRLRAQVADRIRSLITRICVAPVGDDPEVKRPLAMLIERAGKTSLAELLRDPIRRPRYFDVFFKNGGLLTVYPKSENPFQFELQIVSRDGDPATMKIWTRERG